MSLLCMAITLIGGRVYLMGNKPPEFAPADNPASDSDSLLTRTLTFYYLPFLNAWLLLYPRVLSFDWSMESVPLIHSVTDVRNLSSLTFYVTLLYATCYVIRYLNCNVVSASQQRNSSGASYVIASSSHSANGHNSNRSHGENNGHNSRSHSDNNGYFTTSRTNNGHKRRQHHQRRGSTSSTDSKDSEDSSASSTTASSITSSSFSSLAPLSPLTSVQVLLLSLAMLAFPFLPATNLFFYVGFVIAERVLYIPSLGFCLLVAYGAYMMRRRYCGYTNLLHISLMLLICGYSFRTVLRNQDWRSEENLYRAGINVNPAKGKYNSIILDFTLS